MIDNYCMMTDSALSSLSDGFPYISVADVFPADGYIIKRHIYHYSE